MQKFYKVKFGYGIDEYIAIDDLELSKAIRAQISGNIVIFKEGSVSGKHIMAILPDVNRMMGWNRVYQPTAVDYGEIPEKQLSEWHQFLENTTIQIMSTKPPQIT